jgi:hypothetical protein
VRDGRGQRSLAPHTPRQAWEWQRVEMGVRPVSFKADEVGVREVGGPTHGGGRHFTLRCAAHMRSAACA